MRRAQRSRRTACAGFDWTTAFDLIAPHLPKEVISAEQADRARTFARDLPALWHWGILEARLLEGDAEVDILGAIGRDEVARVRMERALRNVQHPAITPARSALAQWLTDDGNPLAKTPMLWFEWDRDGHERPPLLWLCIAPDFFDQSAPALDPDGVEQLVRHLFDADAGLAVPGAVETLKRIGHLLPPGGKLMSFSSLRPRGRDVCRVFVQLPKGGTDPWLRAIGWPGDFQFMAQTRPLFEVDGEAEWCQIEFDERIHPYVGVELSQTDKAFGNRTSRQRWLDEVSGRGWANRARAEAVLAWQGRSAVRLRSGRPVFLQRTFHLKLTSSGDGSPAAKAYLGFSCPRAALTEKSVPPRFRAHLARAS